jgi:hypothetical protein
MKFDGYGPQGGERACVIDSGDLLRDLPGLSGDLAGPVLADLGHFVAAQDFKLYNVAEAIKCQSFGQSLGAPDRAALRAFPEEQK